MKTHISIIILLHTLVILSISCDSQQAAKAPVAAVEDTAAVFQSSLDTLKKIGFTINPQVKESDVSNWWKEIRVYHARPLKALYIAWGGRTNNKPYYYFSNDCWHFDLEAIEADGYTRILENLSRISKGDLSFQHVSNYCNDNEDNKAWVAFELEGDQYKWDMQVDDDWIDANLFYKVQELCKKYNKKGRLTVLPEGQSIVISYLTDSAFNKIKQQTGLPIKWLTPGNWTSQKDSLY